MPEFEEDDDPGYISFNSPGEEVFRITPDGKIIVNSKYNVDEAAQEFWRAVDAARKGILTIERKNGGSQIFD